MRTAYMQGFADGWIAGVVVAVAILGAAVAFHWLRWV